MRFAILVCLVGVLGSGCIFSPNKGEDVGPDPRPPYPKRNTPKNAVLFLTLAWSARDTTSIKAVYADDYAGESIDLTDPSAQTLTFSKSDEVRTVVRMAQSQTIVKVDMDFKLPGGWIEGHYANDDPDWMYVQIPGFTIYINDTVEGEYSATSPGSGETWVFEFTMRPTYPSGPTGEPVWEIVRWKESRANL